MRTVNQYTLKAFGSRDHYETVSESWSLAVVQLPKTFGAKNHFKTACESCPLKAIQMPKTFGTIYHFRAVNDYWSPVEKVGHFLWYKCWMQLGWKITVKQFVNTVHLWSYKYQKHLGPYITSEESVNTGPKLQKWH